MDKFNLQLFASKGGGNKGSAPTPSLPAPTPETNTLPDEFNGDLGDRTERKLDDVINRALDPHRDINPEYGNGDNRYHTNCALCSTAFALNARGYNVEAMPRDKTWRGFDSVYDVDYSNPDNFIVGGNKVGSWAGMPYKYEISKALNGKDMPTMPKGAKAASKAIIEKMKTWGDGSVAVMMVKWKDSGAGHAVNLVNQGGTIKIVDAQCGKKYVGTEIETYLGQTSANHTAIVRLDNATIKSSPKNLDKIVKKKENK